MDIHLNTIEEAIEEIKAGKVIIVVDDEDRENEGDFVAAARYATPEVINFMATYGRGLICAPLVEELCDHLGLSLMVQNNTVLHQTAFTVSVNLIGEGFGTGISASSRSKTVQALINPNTKREDLASPGSIFPLRSRKEGVLRRIGHTEAATDLARLAGLEPAGVIVEIMNDDGTMARLPELMKIAKVHQLKIVSIKDLIKYRLSTESLIKEEVTINLPTEWGTFKMTAYTQLENGATHLALTKGKWQEGEVILARIHKSCFTGDVFGSCRCECGKQLHSGLEMIEKEGKGILVYLNKELNGEGLLDKLRAYKTIDNGGYNINPEPANDERDYGIGAQILRAQNVTKMKLISNNPKRRVGLVGYGLEIIDTVPLNY
ncbi:3,4-dihydroxy-2-butanone-4-phosphate synthase [Pedobacter sp. Du54]|uniref:3,4-dihydroxy-2-butanone-4-phosphate synthase n=1 Tax=Pedobacter anseongensis TaxID=3133439 RepID=UPI0030B2E737